MSVQRLLRVVLLACVVFCASASAAGAQAVRDLTSEAARGTWVSAGAGGGWLRVNCSICGTERFGGPAAVLRMGTTLRPGLLVAAELDGWTRSSDDERSAIVAGSGSAWFFPNPERGLFLRAGAGLVHYRLDEDAGANLFGLQLGAGYELVLTESLRITNSIGIIATTFGSISSEDGVVAEDVSLSMLQIGVSLTRR